VIAREVWGGLLWSARPARVVEDDGDTLVHWTRAGAIGCFATSLFFPGREHLSPGERQLVSLESRQWHYRGVPERGTKLTFIRRDAWASIAPTWHADGRFVHWYVNFQLPAARWSMGYDTLDLVLDIVVEPDWSWMWKDRSLFDDALSRGIFDAHVREAIDAEEERIQGEIASRTGFFEESWTRWVAPSEWETPSLPEDFAMGVGAPEGAVITLAAEPVIAP
jgi:predicted RNA-binding protein associated with RNAse of E/G family